MFVSSQRNGREAIFVVQKSLPLSLQQGQAIGDVELAMQRSLLLSLQHGQAIGEVEFVVQKAVVSLIAVLPHSHSNSHARYISITSSLAPLVALMSVDKSNSQVTAAASGLD